MSMKATDIISEKVSRLWERLEPVWKAVNGLPKRDVGTVSFVVPVWALVCWDAGIFSIQRDLLAWMGRIARHPLVDVVDQLKSLDHMYLTQDSSIESLSTDFVIPFLRAYKEVKFEHVFVSSDAGRSLKKIRTAALFLTHLTLHLGQEEESIQKFEDNLDRISQIHTLPSEHMQRWIARLLGEYDPFGDLYYPRHGNGAVAERVRNHRQKWALVDTCAVKFSLRNSDQGTLPSRLQAKTPPSSATNRCARVITVPKGIDRRRIVCPEPVALMFMQQGIRNVIYVAVQKSELTKSHINFENGDLNADLARDGSISGEYATIDLSSASDSVRWEFVAHLFALVPKWRRALQLTRSTHRMLPDRSVRPNVHFAPMGSALCFPIQTLCYCALCEEAIALDGGKHRTYRVYGDDIIIHESHYATLVHLLDYYGWLVNVDKTFHGDSPFRESCGGHFVYGRDVTPILAGRRLQWNTLRIADHLSPIVDLHNRLYSDYPVSRRYIALKLRHTEVTNVYTHRTRSGEKITRKRTRFVDILHTDVSQDSTKLYSAHPANLMKVRRDEKAPQNSTAPWYQKSYYFSMVPRTEGKTISLSQELRYYEWFVLNCTRPVTYKTEANEHWVWTWAPLW